MRDIEPPEVWSDFAMGLHQDFYIMYPDLNAYIKDFCQQLTIQKKSELKRFLIAAKSQGLSGGRHKNLYRKYGAQFIPKNPEELFSELILELH